MNIKFSLFIAIIILLGSCNKEELLQESVIKNTQYKDNITDIWIKDSLFKPYGIMVKYRWSKYAAPNTNLWPPKEDNVIPVLRIIKKLWIDLYNDKRVGGKDFIKTYGPKVIYLYSGKNLVKNTLDVMAEVISTNASPLQMYIYNVDTFNPNDKKSVRNLMRVVHHNFAKTLIDKKIFKQEEFLKITPNAYYDFENSIIKHNRIDIYEIGAETSANRGFYSFAARKRLIDDFAETVSVILTHSTQDVDKIIKKASKPLDSSDPDAISLAVTAPKALKDKRQFLVEYFNDNWGINFIRTQTISSLNTNKLWKK